MSTVAETVGARLRAEILKIQRLPLTRTNTNSKFYFAVITLLPLNIRICHRIRSLLLVLGQTSQGLCILKLSKFNVNTDVNLSTLCVLKLTSVSIICMCCITWW